MYSSSRIIKINDNGGIDLEYDNYHYENNSFSDRFNNVNCDLNNDYIYEFENT